METVPRRFAPATLSGWIGVGFGLGTLATILVLFILSDIITGRVGELAPLWLRVAIVVGVLVIVVPAIVLGFRARKVDRSILGTLALAVACALGAWFTVTGVASFFME